MELSAEMPSQLFRKKRPKIIIDSNALFLPLQFKIDIFTELTELLKRNFELILLSAVKQELETLAEKKSPKTRKNAAYALKLAEKCTYVEAKTALNVTIDDIIVKVAEEWNAAVFTNDKQLRKRLRDISVPVIYLRQNSRLAIDGMI